jgi:hypothetical protein
MVKITLICHDFKFGNDSYIRGFLTNSMEHGPSWEANSRSASQYITFPL